MTPLRPIWWFYDKLFRVYKQKCVFSYLMTTKWHCSETERAPSSHDSYDKLTSLVWIRKSVTEIYPHVHFGMLLDAGQFLCKSDKRPRTSSKGYVFQKFRNGGTIFMMEDGFIRDFTRIDSSQGIRGKYTFVSRTHVSKIINITASASLDSWWR